MKPKNLMRAAREAITLAAELEARLPAGCAVPPEDLFAVVWPLACQLVTLRRRAKRDGKAARQYRVLSAQVAEILRTRPGSPAPLDALARSVPLNACLWRPVLMPGITADALEAA
jgi:hypothetical protein